MSVESIWDEVVSAIRAGKTGKLKKLASQFDSEAMDGEEYLEDYFNLLVRILSDREVQKSKNIFPFLLLLSPDAERLTKSQRDRLAETIEANIEKFGDEMSVDTAIDFISRNYTQDQILKLLKTVASKNIPNKEAYLHMGAKIAVSNDKMDKETAILFLKENGIQLAEKKQ